MFKLIYKLNVSPLLISLAKTQGSLTREKIAWILGWAKNIKHVNEYRECDMFMFFLIFLWYFLLFPFVNFFIVENFMFASMIF
jgi:hypothetical protein